MKFSEMKYEHPDIDALKKQIESLTDELNSADTFEEADKVFIKMNELSGHIETLGTLVYIRHSVNTLDEYYDKEQKFIDEKLPVLTEYLQQLGLSLLKSKFRPEFENKYGELYFKNEEMQLKTFSPEIISDLQEENRLTTEYEKILASAQIEFDGKICTVPQLLPYKQGADDEKRLAAWTAEGNFYMANKAELDSIYDKLTHLRDNMGKKLGYEGFTALGYYRMMRNSYTKEDVALFRNAVIKYLVPVADKIFRDQAKRTGKSYPLSYADSTLMFKNGNVVPKGSSDDILECSKKLYHELSEETSEFIDFMFDNELLDILSKKGKANGGYCVGIPDYKAQYIFANFNGTADDVETMTHEAGHAFAGYTARNIFPAGLQNPTLESCEIHSMSMEFFAWDKAEGFFGEQAEKFKYQHLAGALKFIPYGTMVDHFQHIVYENPDLTPCERDEEWKKLTKIYMPWIKLGEIPFYGDGYAWQRQHHIYSSPFYYIDYCFAQTVALEFWALMQQDKEKAWNSYMSLVKLAGTKKFTDLVKAAGLDSPFEEKTLEYVSQAALNWLNSFNQELLD